MWQKEEILTALGQNKIGDNWTATGFCLDTRQIKPFEVFIPLKTANRDGHDFIINALEKNAFSLCQKDKLSTLQNLGVPAKTIAEKIIICNDVLHDFETLARYRRRQLANLSEKNNSLSKTLPSLQNYSQKLAMQLTGSKKLDLPPEAKLLGITGSVGKTSIKEMTGFLLKKFLARKYHHNIESYYYKSPANFNNTLGVPLCLLNTASTAEYMVYEAGMNQPHELQKIASILEPDVTIISNIRPVHIGNFPNLAAIAHEKFQLALGTRTGGILILEHASEFFEQHAHSFKNQKQGLVISFGSDTQSDIALLDNQPLASGGQKIIARCFGKTVDYHLNLLGQHQAINSLAALAGLLALGIDITEILPYFARLEDMAGRGKRYYLPLPKPIKSDAVVSTNKIISASKDQQKEKQILVFDESYNGSFSSMLATLDMLADYQDSYFEQQKINQRKIAILGDMKELGDHSQHFHQLLKQHLTQEKKLQSILLVTVGDMMKQVFSNFDNNRLLLQFVNVEELLIKLPTLLQKGDIILIKGSHSIGLARIIDHWHGA